MHDCVFGFVRRSSTRLTLS